MRYRLIVDLPTDRVLWFTEASDLRIAPDEGSVIADYDGTLPEGMSTRNSWNYRFRDQQVTLADIPTEKAVKSVLQINQEEVEKFLRREIKSLTSELHATDFQAEIMRSLKREAATKLLVNGDESGVELLCYEQDETSVEAAKVAAEFILRKHTQYVAFVMEAERVLRTHTRAIHASTDAIAVAAMTTQIKKDLVHLTGLLQS